MANFLKRRGQIEQRLGQYATRLFRVEAHIRQGEVRAARKRLEGLLEDIEQFERDVKFPAELTIVGAQLGFFSGKGHLLRGRLPAALLGATAGWLYGQSTACEYQDAIDEVKSRVEMLGDVLLVDDDEE
jgi:hypothetical protein